MIGEMTDLIAKISNGNDETSIEGLLRAFDNADDIIQEKVDLYVTNFLLAKFKIQSTQQALKAAKTNLRATKNKMKAMGNAWRKRERAYKKWKKAMHKSKYFIVIEK